MSLGRERPTVRGKSGCPGRQELSCKTIIHQRFSGGGFQCGPVSQDRSHLGPTPQEWTKLKLEPPGGLGWTGEGWGGLSGSLSSSVCHLLASCHVRVPAGLLCVLKSGVEGLLLERAIQCGDALMFFVILCAPKSNGALYSQA